MSPRSIGRTPRGRARGRGRARAIEAASLSRASHTNERCLRKRPNRRPPRPPRLWPAVRRRPRCVRARRGIDATGRVAVTLTKTRADGVGMGGARGGREEDARRTRGRTIRMDSFARVRSVDRGEGWTRTRLERGRLGGSQRSDALRWMSSVTDVDDAYAWFFPCAQKWSKGKMKEKANNQVLFEQVREFRRASRRANHRERGRARCKP